MSITKIHPATLSTTGASDGEVLKVTGGTVAFSTAGGTTVYDTIDSLPTTGNSIGDQAFVSGNNRLYLWNGSGWYNIALINTDPTIDANNRPDSDYTLSSEGSTTTVTLFAEDPEGLSITYSAIPDADFSNLATISQSANVFTITPADESNANTTSGTVTFRASDGVNLASTLSSFTLQFSITNSKFTEAHLKASGNNGNNTDINDASTNNHTITVNGNAAAQAFTPYHPGGYSTYFDGSGDYLKIASSADFNLNSTDFTIEGWFYATAPASSEHIWASYIDGSDNRESLYFTNATTLSWWVNGSTRISATIAADNWYHFAIVDNSGTTTFYLNGVSQGTWTSTYTDGNRIVWLGTYNDGGYAPDNFTGYLRDIRCVKGTAVYTANFTPPHRRLTAVTNTKLLTCHLPYIADGSSDGRSITVNGNTNTQRFGPYDYLAYDATNHGASVFFDGTGDYLTAAHDTTLEIASSDFTLEVWYYPTSTTNGHIIGKRSAGANYGGYQIYWDSSKFGVLADTDTSTPWAVSLLTTGTFPINTWYHIAFTRNGNNCYLYVNGVQKATTSFTGTVNTNASTSFSVGAIGNGDQPLTGFVSDARLVKGTAVYTAAFIPPTAPLTAVTNTQLLTCSDAPDVFDSSGRKLVSLFGVTSANANTKYASSNIILDGGTENVFFYPDTGSYHNDVTGDFTVETWIKLESSTLSYPYLWIVRSSSNTSGPRIIARFGDSGFGYHLQFELNGTGVANVYSVNLTQSNFNTYRHVALTRSNGVVRCFVDGTQYSFGTGADPSSFPNSTISFSNSITSIDQLYIGYAVDGQMEDFRFTNGLARYTSNFTPPTEELVG